MADEKKLATTPEMGPDLIRQWMNNQAREIEQRHQETQLARQKDQNQFEFAQMALKAQAEDFEKNRIHERKQSATNRIFVTGVLLIVFSFLVYALHTGKDSVALEIIKSVVLIAGGGAGGYALGLRKKHRVGRTNGE